MFPSQTFPYNPDVQLFGCIISRKGHTLLNRGIESQDQYESCGFAFSTLIDLWGAALGLAECACWFEGLIWSYWVVGRRLGGEDNKNCCPHFWSSPHTCPPRKSHVIFYVGIKDFYFNSFLNFIVQILKNPIGFNSYSYYEKNFLLFCNE